MKTNNKNIAMQAILEMDSINESLKKEAKQTVKALLAETIKDELRDIEDEEDDYVVLEAEKGTKKSVSEDGEEEMDPTAAAAQGAQEAPEAQDAEAAQPAEGEAQAPQEGDADWSEFDQYKVDDNTYDLTGVEDKEQLVKVYKLLNDEDQVAIKKDGNKVEIKDNETGAEYVIDLGEDEAEAGVEDEAAPVEAQPEEGGEGQEQLSESLEEGDFFHNEDLDDEEQLPDTEDEYEIELDKDEDEDEFAGFEDEDDEDFDEDLEDGPEHTKFEDGEGYLSENKKKAKKTMKENKEEVIFEVDLGYTDDYQDKDPIVGLSNDEPSKSGKSWHKGLPTGTEKPWAGKGTEKKGDPFDKVVNEEFEGDDIKDEVPESELDEAATSKSKRDKRHATKTRSLNPKEYDPEVTKVNSHEGAMNENKQLRAAIKELRKSLNEAYITNVNLGKITKLFLENATTKAEKVEIINRFTNESKTAEQAQTLYESIDRQLKKNVQEAATIAENKETTTKTVIKENKSKDLMNIIDFTNRVMNC